MTTMRSRKQSPNRSSNKNSPMQQQAQQQAQQEEQPEPQQQQAMQEEQQQQAVAQQEQQQQQEQPAVQQQQQEQQQEQQVAAEAEPAGPPQGGTLRLGIVYSPANYAAPYSGDIAFGPAIWETLTKYGADGLIPEPHLAESWEFNDDQTVLTMTLRQD